MEYERLVVLWSIISRSEHHYLSHLKIHYISESSAALLNCSHRTTTIAIYLDHRCMASTMERLEQIAIGHESQSRTIMYQSRKYAHQTQNKAFRTALICQMQYRLQLEEEACVVWTRCFVENENMKRQCQKRQDDRGTHGFRR